MSTIYGIRIVSSRNGRNDLVIDETVYVPRIPAIGERIVQPNGAHLVVCAVWLPVITGTSRVHPTVIVTRAPTCDAPDIAKAPDLGALSRCTAFVDHLEPHTWEKP